MLFKVLLLIMSVEGGALIVDPSEKTTYQSKAKCEAAIKKEVAKVVQLIDKEPEARGKLAVTGGRCFSLDEINKIRGGQSAKGPSLNENIGEENVD